MRIAHRTGIPANIILIRHQYCTNRRGQSGCYCLIDPSGPGNRGGVSAIETTHPCLTFGVRQPLRVTPRAVFTLAALILLGAALFASPAMATTGLSATGELAFYPCTDCHPVVLGADGNPTTPLPVDMEQHQIELQVHDILGAGDEACVACHDDPSRNPGKLLLPDGNLVDITGEVSRVCQTCHFEQYRQWEVGIHGRGEAKCSAAGCHNPHSPSWIYVAALPPFQGTGIEVNAVGADREPFKPMAGYPVDPPVYTPTWLVIVAALGGLFCVALLGFVTLGRRKS